MAELTNEQLVTLVSERNDALKQIAMTSKTEAEAIQRATDLALNPKYTPIQGTTYDPATMQAVPLRDDQKVMDALTQLQFWAQTRNARGQDTRAVGGLATNVGVRRAMTKAFSGKPETWQFQLGDKKWSVIPDPYSEKGARNLLVVAPGTTQLSEADLAEIRRLTGDKPILPVSAGTGYQIDVGRDGTVYSSFEEGRAAANPFPTGGAGRLQAGIAAGTFTKNQDGSWNVGNSGETTTGIGFARLLARQYGFDATTVRPGQSITIGEDGLVEFNGQRFQPLSGTAATSLVSKIENAIQSGALTAGNFTTTNLGGGFGAGGAGMGAGGFGAGTMTNPFTPGTPEAQAWEGRKSAYDLLYSQFNQYGLGSLVQPLQGLIQEGVSPSEFVLRLRDTDAYKRRFAANQARIQKGLSALSEAQYIALEDQYQDVMRRYGLPPSYYTRGDLGRQEGFEKFIAGDVSPVELEDRIQTVQRRVLNANPEVSIALRNFYPNITNGDILAYALDPNRAIDEINRKITAAEIGGAAVQAGLTTNESDAEYLARYGITKEQAQQGYRTISGYLPRAQQLSSFYTGQVEGGPYTQASAEREVFGTPGAAEEERKRQRITALETAAFSGQSGLTGGALGRERAGQF